MDEISNKTSLEYEPMSLVNVIKNSLWYWLKNLKSYWIINFVFQLAIIALAYSLFFLSGGNLRVAELAGYLGVQIPFWLIASYVLDILSLAMFIILGFVIILNICIQVLLAGMVIRHTADHHSQQFPTLRLSYSQSRDRFWHQLGTQILILILSVGVGVGGMILMVVIGVFLALFLGIAGLFVGIGIGGSLLVIFVVYMTTRLTVAIPAVVIDGEGARGAVNRSWNLVSDNWWRTFLINLVIGIITILIGLPAAYVTAMITLSFYYPSLTMMLIIIYITLSAIIYGFTGPLSPTTSTMIYIDLMGRKGSKYKPSQPLQFTPTPDQRHPYQKCPVCDQSVTGSDRFCPRCGRDLTVVI